MSKAGGTRILMNARHVCVVAGLALASPVWGQQERSAPPGTEGQARFRFSRDVQPILDANCVQCHALEIAQAELVLEDGISYDMLVRHPSTESALMRVAPGAPGESYLLLKLKGAHLEAGGTGLGMPLTEGNYTPLPEPAIAAIESWIAAGAQAD